MTGGTTKEMTRYEEVRRLYIDKCMSRYYMSEEQALADWKRSATRSYLREVMDAAVARCMDVSALLRPTMEPIAASNAEDIPQCGTDLTEQRIRRK